MNFLPSFRPLLAILASAALSSTTAQGQGGTFGNLSYSSDGTSVTITSCSGNPTSITIPAEIDGLPVRTINGLGFTTRNFATSVSLPEGLTTISASAFSGFRVLTSLTLPSTLTSLGDRAFGGCAALTSVTILGCPSTLKSTFSSCTALTSITNPSGVTVLDSTFSSCTSLTSINLPAGLTTLTSTFSDCTSLASVVLPASVTTLSGTFRNCASLTNITLPAGLTTLGANTFSNCPLLTEMTIPSGITTLGDSAFASCIGLQQVTLPAGLNTLGNFVFDGCTSLGEITLPDSLTTIGSGAFSGCTSFTTLTVPNSVTTIGDDAFWGCSGLTSFNIPDRFLASLSAVGLDYQPGLATDALITGIANKLANNPAFVTKLANEIISKTDHYGLSTQGDLSDLSAQTPQTIRSVLAQIAIEQGPSAAITSSLDQWTVKRSTPVVYRTTTNFGASAFTAIGLPAGLLIDPASGVISGRATKVGTYSVFLHAGVPGGKVVSSAKIIEVVK